MVRPETLPFTIPYMFCCHTQQTTLSCAGWLRKITVFNQISACAMCHSASVDVVRTRIVSPVRKHKDQPVISANPLFERWDTRKVGGSWLQECHRVSKATGDETITLAASSMKREYWWPRFSDDARDNPLS